jgi:hypothetical protein
MPFMALGRGAMGLEGCRACLGLQVGEVGMQVCGFPSFDQERREREKKMMANIAIPIMAGSHSPM